MISRTRGIAAIKVLEHRDRLITTLPTEQVSTMTDSNFTLPTNGAGESAETQTFVSFDAGVPLTRVGPSEIREIHDLINARRSQVDGICALASQFSSYSDLVAGDAIANAMWAVTDLLADIGYLADRWRGLGSQQAKAPTLSNI